MPPARVIINCIVLLWNDPRISGKYNDCFCDVIFYCTTGCLKKCPIANRAAS